LKNIGIPSSIKIEIAKVKIMAKGLIKELGRKVY
jgi:hypothetical protein